MVKSLSLFSAFLALAITSPAIAATFESTPFETLSVDSTTPLSKVFSTALQNGARYKIEASGQYTPDFRFEQRGEFWSVDARFVSRDNFATQNDQDPNFSNFDFGLFSTALGGDNDDFWGTYQSSHIYSYEFIGTGNPVDFYVNDISQPSGGDNAGSLTVKIFREQVQSVPEPGSIVGFLALGAMGAGSALMRKKGQKSGDNNLI